MDESLVALRFGDRCRPLTYECGIPANVRLHFSVRPTSKALP